MRIQAGFLVFVVVLAAPFAAVQGEQKPNRDAEVIFLGDLYREVASHAEINKKSPSKDYASPLFFEPEFPELSEKLRRVPEEKSKSSSSPRYDEEHWIGNAVSCDVCKFLVGTVRKMIMEKKTTEEIIQVAITICKTFKIETDRICELVVPQYAEMVLGVVDNTVFSDEEVCGMLIGTSCGSPYNPFDQMWNITISSKPKPPVKPRVLPKPGSPTLRFLHLTDIHLDSMYLAGADADCGEPVCCRACDTYPAPNETRRAGPWGDYRNCDTFVDTLTLLFKHLSNISDQFDYVIFTGDLPAHDVWNQTRSQLFGKLELLSTLCRNYLPNKPVYTCFGNHDTVPCNSFPPDTVPDQPMDWLFSAYLQAWGNWLPATVAPTIMKGGYYTFSPFPGFRIISLNTNYGASDNWWLLLNATDPQGQLQWLADTLQAAEDKGEKVHILSHHPPGHLMKGFALNYYLLVNRYESTIVGQFHGHTHHDEYEVFYDLHNMSRPVSMSYIAGSITPYSYTNPAYRIYTMDGNYNGSSWEILDYTHYYVDLPTTTNSSADPVWRMEYSAKAVYGMPSVFPEDWNNLIYRMKANDTLFQDYYRFFAKSAPVGTCDKTCKHNKLCGLKKAGTDDPNICNDV